MKISVRVATACCLLSPPGTTANPAAWLRGASRLLSLSSNPIIEDRKLNSDGVNPRDIAYPMGRFIPWASVDGTNQQQYMDVLTYTEESWNTLGTNEWEWMAYATIKELDISTFEIIASNMGILPDEEESWDCHVNHYGDYFWSELVEYNISQYYEKLGWDADKWATTDESEYPDSELKDWFELSEEEKEGALGICYFAETWTGIPIGEWSISMADDGESPTETSPPSRVTSSPRPEISREDIVSSVRFIPWVELSLEQQTFAGMLGYNETLWDILLTNDVEYTGYGSLTAMQQDGAEALDLDSFVWDCLIQHYYSYTWEELALAGVQQYWMALNWTSQSWLGIAAPPTTETTPYDELSTEQQEALLQLCYLPETWLYGGGNIEDLSFVLSNATNATSTWSLLSNSTTA